MQPLAPGATLGIVGGGQLGRMLASAAARHGLKTHIFDPASDAPAGELAAEHTCAPYIDQEALRSFASACDVVTYEFENIPSQALETLANHVTLRPGIASLEKSQDRLVEKRFLEGLGLTLAPFAAIDGPDDIAKAHASLGGDTILKTRRLGYDGKGQARLTDGAGHENAWQSIGAAPAVLEARIPFIAEISAIVVRGADGNTIAYDVPVNTHREGILHQSALGAFAPFNVPAELAASAQDAAITVAHALNHVGTLTVEFFLTDENILLVNEFAPRVHNSGHWTMDACLNSQFDNHVRAVAGWPLGSAQRHSDALMTNLIGADADAATHMLSEPGKALHLYGKAQARKGRKMGHINQIAPRHQSH